MLHAIAIRPFCLLSSESGGIFSLMWELLAAKVSGLQKAQAGEKNHGFSLDTFALRSYLKIKRRWTCRRRDSRFNQPFPTISPLILALDFVSAGPTNRVSRLIVVECRMGQQAKRRFKRR
jgi:hypothetical protein